MWSRTHSDSVRGVKAERVWQVWTDVNRWHTWQPDIEYARLEGDFAPGNRFSLKPRGGPKVNIEIITAVPNQRFTDLTRFPGARMYGDHEFIVRDDALEIRTTMRVEGPLAFLWRKLVAEGVAKGMQAQTAQLVQKAVHE
jgi:uncharacterized protein YndB with AHSA1/START domain